MNEEILTIIKQELESMETKEEIINFLELETHMSKEDCLKAYEILSKLKDE